METAEFKVKALPIEKLIEERLTEDCWIIGELEDKPSSWTWAINNLLKEVARTLHSDCLIACKQHDIRDCSEWLYDFVCYEDNYSGLDNVFFVAESQWMNQWHKTENYDGIRFDFEKLILARCEIRIMIFEANNENEIKNYITLLNKIVANSKLTQPNDRYMYVAWDFAKTDFYIDLYIHQCR
jgi:hypothetical protein